MSIRVFPVTSVLSSQEGVATKGDSLDQFYTERQVLKVPSHQVETGMENYLL